MSRASGRWWSAVAILLLGAQAALHAQNSFAEDTWKDGREGQSRAAPPPPAPGGGAISQVPPLRTPSNAPVAPDTRFAAVARTETEDFGVPARDQLHAGPMHAPTPTQIPGGSVISTEALHQLFQQGAGKFIVFDVLGGPQGLPGAQNALPAGQGGSFSDQTQQGFGQYLGPATQGNKQLPLIFYCQSAYCWMSYNAALRAINLGYTQVRWYRGGIEAWQQAGLQTQPRPQQN